MGEYSKSIIHYPAGTGESIVSDTLFDSHVPMSKRLHDPGPYGKCVIPDEDVWHGMFSWRQSDVTSYKGCIEGGSVEDSTVRRGTITVNVSQQEPVL